MAPVPRIWGPGTRRKAAIPLNSQHLWATYNNQNQITSASGDGPTAFTYDLAGNVTNDSINQYVYDVEGRICAVMSGTGSFTQCVYDAEGRRVAKGSIAALPAAGSACAAPTAANGFSLTNVYLRGLHGDQDTELDGSGNWLHTNIFAAGGLTATYWSNGTNPPSYAFSDWLGTKRLQTNNNPSPETYWKSDPWGDYLYTYGSGGDATEHHFTGKERDTESGLDYFGARYYASSMGSWLSPDWSAKEDPVPYAKLDNPQSLNLYQYVLNNPLSHTDDDGHEIIYVTTGPGALKNEQTVRDSVTAILANPNTSGYLQQFVGTAPGTPDLVIQNGDLSAGDSKTTAPDGTPGTSTVQGNTDPNVTTDGQSGGPIITIDNRTTAAETPGVLTHEAVHAGESQKNPAQFVKDSKAEAGLPHDKRPQEQRANAVQKAQGPAIAKAVKQIEKERKKEQKNQ